MQHSITPKQAGSQKLLQIYCKIARDLPEDPNQPSVYCYYGKLSKTLEPNEEFKVNLDLAITGFEQVWAGNYFSEVDTEMPDR